MSSASNHNQNDEPGQKKTAALPQILQNDPALFPYEKVISRRLQKIESALSRLTAEKISLPDFASGHDYFGLHLRDNRWVLREWAPNADRIFLIGDMTAWQEKESFALHPLNKENVWEISLPADKLKHLDFYRLRIHWPGGAGDRIPAYARRVVQDPQTLIFSAQVWNPEFSYNWMCSDFRRPVGAPLIYEVHIGMAQDKEGVGSYQEFTQHILPRIVKSGYNTIQLMAVQEHPYYGSFGYQVSNFFAASSRFGTPEDLKRLIDQAHASGLAVLMDIVHSHAVSNENEGLSRFDGTLYQYFHDGERGLHRLWDSRCFDYGKYEVLHFLLSNCRFWLDEYRFDGLRFDGITSMLYLHHGMNKSFSTYDDYFGSDVDEDALTYLALANRLIHELRPDAITIAEDVSGMPGLAVPQKEGGYGFDYRFAMGIPDYWIKLTKEVADEYWPVGHLWYELTNRRTDEKTISYAESHDQALVGDKSLIFRLIDAVMYEHMAIGDNHIAVERGMALHKMIRLITLACAGAGYLNFMGNEFGHPEWIDFPREGNNWSYKHARRQWHLVDNPELKFRFLAEFDRDMIAAAKKYSLLEQAGPYLLHEHTKKKLLLFRRAGLLFAFNFHPDRSFADFMIEAPAGKYDLILDTDAAAYGGPNRLTENQEHFTMRHRVDKRTVDLLGLYLPARSGQVLQHVV
jgi:1,4-alpha-glucan branching enzyme